MDSNEKKNTNEKLADKIRVFCRDRYIIPARERGEIQIEIRVGDVHQNLGLKSRYGSVDDAIGSNIFQSLAKVKQISKTGPPHAPNAKFLFQILR